MGESGDVRGSSFCSVSNLAAVVQVSRQTVCIPLSTVQVRVLTLVWRRTPTIIPVTCTFSSIGGDATIVGDVTIVEEEVRVMVPLT